MRVAYDTYCQFKTEYFGGPARIHLRLGQAFLNKFFPNVSDPDLYYDENNRRADADIIKRYIRPEWEVSNERAVDVVTPIVAAAVLSDEPDTFVFSVSEDKNSLVQEETFKGGGGTFGGGGAQGGWDAPAEESGSCKASD